MTKRTACIIAEYNPFHNGHKYQLDYAKNELNADYCVVVMGGNFVQRGIPAIADKYCRAHSAVSEGADVVFELPACFATGSLDDLAFGAVSLINSLGVGTHLVFGSETGELETLSRLSGAMRRDENSCGIIRSAMKNGLSVSAARQTELAEISDERLFADCLSAVSQPNNMLGVLFLNALSRVKSSVIPVTHTRIGQAYLDDGSDRTGKYGSFASASAIRRQLFSGEGIAISEILKYMPENSGGILAEYLRSNRPATENDCMPILREKLSSLSCELTDFSLVSPLISERIGALWQTCESWDELVKRTAMSDYSPARVSRCLIHILLGITEKLMREYLENEVCCYAKVLASSEKGEQLIETIRNTCSVPVLRGDEEVNLSARAESQLNIDKKADEIYNRLQNRYETEKL